MAIDLTGFQKSVRSQTNKLFNIAICPVGRYWVKIKTKDGVAVQKLVKK